MHELGTNATKHGALSNPSGSVTIGWARGSQDQGVELVWQERGGPPVTEPTRKGFGQVVFERIGASLDGDISIDFRPEGFVCTVTIAANNLMSKGRHTHFPASLHSAAAPRKDGIAQQI
jgi:two-component sensor histidine kinase